MPIGGRPITCRLGKSICATTRFCESRLKLDHVKPRLLGHWGTTPGQNFIYVHLNRIINDYDLNMIYIAGPGHGGPALVGNTYLEGTYSEFYPNITEDEVGLKRLFKQFSFPGGIPSHVAPETPGSIHEGGELGYSLSHAFGAAFDNPDLIVACVIGDGEAETGPLATGWHSNKFLNAASTGPFCRSSTSTATKSPIRPCWPASAARNSSSFSRLRLCSLFCRRATTRRDASAHGGNARQSGGRNPADSDQRAAKQINSSGPAGR